jgi:hypothetical protein
VNVNVGSLDRILRVIVGLALIAMVFVGPQTPWGWIGIVPAAPSAAAFFRGNALARSASRSFTLAATADRAHFRT